MKTSKIVLLAIIVFIAACTSNSTKPNADKVEKEDAHKATLSEQEAKDMFYHFLAPGDILHIIDATQLNFDPALLNNIENAENYLDSKTKISNLGVYVADLAYIALFGQHDKALPYIATIKKLSTDAHVKIASTDNINIESVLNSQSFNDSLIGIANNTFYQMIENLEKNDRKIAAVDFSVGAFIECLYIAVNISEEYDPNSLLMKEITHQRSALVNLLAYTKENIDTAEKDTSLSCLFELKEVFDNLTTTDVKNENETIQVMDENSYNIIKEKIDSIRNELVKI